MSRVGRKSSAVNHFSPIAHQLDLSSPDFWHPRYYLPHTMLRPKRGGLVQFLPNDPQMLLCDAVYHCLTHGKWLAHLKARREGASTLLTAVLMQHVMFRTGVVGGLLSNKGKGSLVSLQDMCRRQWRCTWPAWRPHIPAGLGKSLEFPDLDSKVLIESARGEEPFRGETLHALFADEISTYPKGDEVWAAALSAVPDPSDGGFVMAASTPHHYGDAMHKLVQEAQKPESPWHFLFIPWMLMSEYQAAPPISWVPSQDVRAYSDKHKLTAQQAYWVESMGLPKVGGSWPKFLAEYPPNELDCFVRSGNERFDPDRLLSMHQDLPVALRTGATAHADDALIILEPPDPRCSYILAADPAGSFESADSWGLVMINVQTGRQVVEFKGKRHAALMAATIVMLSNKYNGCRVYVEANGVGDSVLAFLTNPLGGSVTIDGVEIQTRLPRGRLYFRPSAERERPGWWNSAREKAQAEGFLQELIKDGSWTFRTRRMINQLLTYRGGWVGNQRDEEGGHFDLVAAASIAAWAFMMDRQRLAAPVLPKGTVETVDALSVVWKRLAGGKPSGIGTKQGYKTPWGEHR